MSKSSPSTGRKNVSAFVLILVGIVLVGGSLYFYTSKDSGADYGLEDANVEAPVADTEAEATAPVLDNNSEIDVEAALAPRVLGNEDAPIKIMEFSSLSCGHCANFHATTLKDLKAEYIDAGKVRVVFSDFPLNASALDASMVARCLPADQYVAFTDMLFANQEDWAFVANYRNKLKEYAADYGMGADTFDACLASEELRQGIISRVEAGQKRWGISATPTFVVDDKTVINGVQPLSAFEAVFESNTTE